MMNRDRRACERALDMAMPHVASEMARLVGSGLTLQLAIGEMADSQGAVISDELARVSRSINSGMTMEEALVEWSERSPAECVTMLVAACRIGMRQGGDLPAALDGVSASLTDVLELRAEAAALSAQARLSAYVLSGLPVAGLLLFSVLDPSILRTLVTTRPGRILLIVGLTLNGVGLLVMRRLVERTVGGFT